MFGGEKIPPSWFDQYLHTHDWRAPCCLCAFLDEEQYTESTVRLVEKACPDGIDIDRCYVAMCATGRCGYFRKSSLCLWS